jgi:DNA (cytosine-5)-methyltransferase 1
MTLGTNQALADRYEDLYPVVAPLIYASGVPAVIENPSARPDMVLCGEMFGLGVLRHRKFELVNWSAPAPAHVKHRGRVRGWRHGTFYDGPYIAAYGKGGGKGSAAEIQEAMGIDWTDVHEELTEAIPPAYTEYIGRQFLAQRDNPTTTLF